MRKRLCEILTIIILTSLLYHYAEAVSEQKETMCLSEKITDEGDKPNMSAATGELSMEETVKETPEEETTELYQEVVESAKLDWHWVIGPGEMEDFHFLGSTYIAVKKENGKYGIMDA